MAISIQPDSSVAAAYWQTSDGTYEEYGHSRIFWQGARASDVALYRSPMPLSSDWLYSVYNNPYSLLPGWSTLFSFGPDLAFFGALLAAELKFPGLARIGLYGTALLSRVLKQYGKYFLFPRFLGAVAGKTLNASYHYLASGTNRFFPVSVNIMPEQVPLLVLLIQTGSMQGGQAAQQTLYRIRPMPEMQYGVMDSSWDDGNYLASFAIALAVSGSHIDIVLDEKPAIPTHEVSAQMPGSVENRRFRVRAFGRELFFEVEEQFAFIEDVLLGLREFDAGESYHSVLSEECLEYIYHWLLMDEFWLNRSNWHDLALSDPVPGPDLSSWNSELHYRPKMIVREDAESGCKALDLGVYDLLLPGDLGLSQASADCLELRSNSHPDSYAAPLTVVAKRQSAVAFYRDWGQRMLISAAANLGLYGVVTQLLDSLSAGFAENSTNVARPASPATIEADSSEGPASTAMVACTSLEGIALYSSGTPDHIELSVEPIISSGSLSSIPEVIPEVVDNKALVAANMSGRARKSVHWKKEDELVVTRTFDVYDDEPVLELDEIFHAGIEHLKMTDAQTRFFQELVIDGFSHPEVETLRQALIPGFDDEERLAGKYVELLEYIEGDAQQAAYSAETNPSESESEDGLDEAELELLELLKREVKREQMWQLKRPVAESWLTAFEEFSALAANLLPLVTSKEFSDDFDTLTRYLSDNRQFINHLPEKLLFILERYHGLVKKRHGQAGKTCLENLLFKALQDRESTTGIDWKDRLLQLSIEAGPIHGLRYWYEVRRKEAGL